MSEIRIKWKSFWL